MEVRLDEILAQHKLFQEGLGTLQGYSAKIYVEPSASPKFCKPRGIPYKAIANGPVGQVLAKPPFLKVNSKFHFTEKCNKQKY